MQIDKWKECIDKLQQGDRLALSQVLTEIETNNENTAIPFEIIAIIFSLSVNVMILLKNTSNLI